MVCIETSHYVAYVKGGSEGRWYFYDSMSDRKGGIDGFNIPEVREVKELNELFNADEQGLDFIKNVKEEKLPNHVRRILRDGFMCFYQSNEVKMYQ